MKRRTFLRLLSGSTVATLGLVIGFKPLRGQQSSGFPGFSLISQALDFMKRSGDMELELGAINLKLDQILRNQHALFDALKAMNETLDDLQHYEVEIPSETISLEQVIAAQSRYKSVADNFVSLQRRPRDQKALSLLERDRDKLYDLSNELFSAVSATTRPPGFIIAAEHLLNAAVLINRYDTRFPGRRTATNADRLKATAFNVMSVLQAMTGEAGVRTRLPLLNEKFKLRKADIASLPFARLLPTDFPDPSQQSNVGKTVATSATMCLMSGVSTKVIHGETIKEMGDKRPYIVGSRSDERQTYQLTHVQYEVQSLAAFGGKRAFKVTMESRKGWTSDAWSRVVHKESNKDDEETSAQPRSKIKDCVQIADSTNGAPKSFLTFQMYLERYAALVALEARLLALQRVGEGDLKRAVSLYDSVG